MYTQQEKIIKKAKECLDRLSEEIIFLKTIVSLDSTLLKENFVKENVFKSYYNFFVFLVIVAFLSAILTISKFFDKRKDSYSLYYLFENDPELKNNKNDLFTKIKNLEKESDNLLRFRKKILAHIDISENKSTLKGFDNKNFIDIKLQIEKVIVELESFINEIRGYYYVKGPKIILSKLEPETRITTIYHGEVFGVVEEFQKILEKLKIHEITS